MYNYTGINIVANVSERQATDLESLCQATFYVCIQKKK